MQGIEEYPGNVRIPFYAKKEVNIKSHAAAAKLQIGAAGKGDHMNKWKTLALSLLICCLAVAASGTLAYYTATEQAHNVITSGGIAIDLQEYSDADDQLVPFEDVDGVMPGMKVTKIAEVRNTGKGDAWVRVKLVKSITMTNQTASPNLDLIRLELDNKDWKLANDGYYYYQKVLKSGETTTPILNSVTFDKAMGNEYQNATATVDVAAQAVQTANNGDTVMDAKGWPNA